MKTMTKKTWPSWNTPVCVCAHWIAVMIMHSCCSVFFSLLFVSSHSLNSTWPVLLLLLFSLSSFSPRSDNATVRPIVFIVFNFSVARFFLLDKIHCIPLNRRSHWTTASRSHLVDSVGRDFFGVDATFFSRSMHEKEPLWNKQKRVSCLK